MTNSRKHKLLDEVQMLSANMDELKHYLGEPEFSTLPMNERILLKIQMEAMTTYREVLDIRVDKAINGDR